MATTLLSLPSSVSKLILWIICPPSYDRFGANGIMRRKQSRMYDRGRYKDCIRLAIFHRKLLILTGCINVEGSQGLRFPSTIWSFQRSLDVWRCFQSFVHDIVPPQYGSITAILMGILAIYYLITKVIKLYQAIHKSSLKTSSPPVSAHTIIASLSASVFTSKTFDMFGDDFVTAVVDNSATGHIFNDATFFTTPIEPTLNTAVATIGKTTLVPSGKGDVEISFKDDHGKCHKISLQSAYYFPDSPVNIISVTALAHQLGDHNGTYVKTCMQHSIFTWDHDKHHCTLLHPASGLPELPLILHNAESAFTTFMNKFDQCFVFANRTSQSKSSQSTPADISPAEARLLTSPSSCIRKVHFKDDEGAKLLTSDSSCIKKVHFKDDEDNASSHSLSILQDEFLQWHERLNHIPLSRMITLAEKGFLPKKFLQLRQSLPPCGVCLFGHARRRPWRSKGPPSSIKKASETYPGAGTSTDQLVSAQPGLVPQFSGALTSDRINGATIFVDHYSGYTYVHLMRRLTSEETLEAKQSYEAHADTFGVTVQKYRADNGRFADTIFQHHAQQAGQLISYAGVGSHHQNGIAEKKIGDLTSLARTILLHAHRNWPEAISLFLWPFALKYAAYIMNTFYMDQSGTTPMSKFSGVPCDELPVSHAHTFGCPCYVLDARLQSGLVKPPKWEPRSDLWIFVGNSPIHAQSVALVLNPISGLVSPQFHVVFDDHFQTLNGLHTNSVPSSWSTLCKENFEFFVTDLPLTSTSDAVSGVSTSEIASPLSLHHGGENTGLTVPLHGSALPNGNDSGGAALTVPQQTMSTSVSLDSLETATIHNPDQHNNSTSGTLMLNNGTNTSSLLPYHSDFADLGTSGLRRSGRSVHPTSRATESSLNFKKILGYFTAVFAAIGMAYHSPFPAASCFFTQTIEHSLTVSMLVDKSFNSFPLFALAAEAEQNEVFTYKEAMKQDDNRDFIKAMIKEINDHEQRNHWTMIPRSSLPANVKTILSIWSFKRKRHPDGRLMKHKARICAHGGMPRWGIDYWETYSPVVNWISVRALLAISAIHNLPTKSIDFVLAFPQADLDTDVYMEFPAGFSQNLRRTHVLKLNKSLYGLKQASSNWFKHLSNGLIKRGLKQSNLDKCVYYKDGLIVLVYVDDCIVIGHTESHISSFITSLKNGSENFDFTEEGSLREYLGVEITQLDKSSFEMKQPYLIKKIVELLSNDASNPRPTPALREPLGKDECGPERKYDWNYRSIIGMLNYLQGSMRPDISMAVHQCARFTNCPKLSHERAILHLSKSERYCQSRNNLCTGQKRNRMLRRCELCTRLGSE